MPFNVVKFLFFSLCSENILTEISGMSGTERSKQNETKMREHPPLPVFAGWLCDSHYLARSALNLGISPE
jgi:hypothetical protein